MIKSRYDARLEMRRPDKAKNKKALIQPMKARLIDNQMLNPIIRSRIDGET
jgi:hypothetical protein